MALDKSLLTKHSEGDFWMREAINVIESTYGDRVYLKAKNLLKFGASDLIDTTYELVWNQGGEETDPTSNAITHISSSSLADTESMTIEGHTIDGNGDFTFLVQTVTLAGQTKTALSTPLARSSRLYNNDTVPLVGDVYVYEDDTLSFGVPTTAANIHLKILAGDQQSFKAKTTISKDDYFIVTGGYGSIREKTATVVDFQLEVRQKGSIYRPALTISTNGPPIVFPFKPYIIVPANADVRVTAEASGAGKSVNAGFYGVLAARR